MELSNKQGRYVGNVAFGNFLEKAVMCSTFNKVVYLHIKDRQRQRTVTLKASDFNQLMKLKEKIYQMIDKGNRILAREAKHAFIENTLPDDVDNDTYIIETSDDDSSVCNENVKTKSRKRKRSCVSSGSENDSDIENKENKPPGKKSKHKLVKAQTSVVSEEGKVKPKRKYTKKSHKQSSDSEKQRVRKRAVQDHNLVRTLSSSTISSQE